MKCIVFVRVSTERQEVDSQLKDTIDYAKSLDFDDFVIISRIGASAFEVSKFYLEMIDELKDTVERDKDIKAVVCWHLNRLCRNDVIAADLKQFLINHKVNLYIKEPTIKLLNDDLTVNSGAELAFSLFATMAKQQAEELRKKTIRAKKRDMRLHKYIGGPVVKYGYRVNKDKYIEPDPVESEIVKEIFDIYINECHSYPKTTREINERRGINLTEPHIIHIIRSKKYYNESQYPAIITEEIYRQAEEVRKNNNCTKDTQHRNRRFANRLIECPVCGSGYTANVRDYRCITRGCKGMMLSIPKLDGLLWLIASHLESERLLNTSAKDEYLQKKAVLAAKIASVESSATKDAKARERAKKCVVEGIITIEEYKERIRTLDNENEMVQKKVLEWRTEIDEIDRLMSEDTNSIKKILEIADNISAKDELQMRDIVRKWIRHIAIKDDILTIETLTRTYKCIYNPWGKKYSWYTVGKKPLAVRYIRRTKFGEVWFDDIRVKPTELPYTLAWLSGSEIV